MGHARDQSPPVARDHPTVLDGGLSTALEGLGADLGSSLWTAGC